VTTTTAPATAWTGLETALRQRQPVRVTYHGQQRLICPHALRWNNGRPLVLGYQIGGQTSSGTLPADPRHRWRCLFIDEIDHIEAADSDHPWATADNYNPARPLHAIDNVVTIAIPEPRPQPA
jgi:hypothetical protein